ncbi:MAG TPA: hypothetical protein VGC42_23710 [Kofleriaceae bacterium]
MRRAVVALALVLAAPAAAAPRRPPASGKKTPAQQEADRHFKSGVALFKETKYAEALAEFQRAYDIAPHPLVLYNIAGCQRELSQYGDAVAAYTRFLTEGKGVVPAARLTAAKAELDAILARIARVSVTITPTLDGTTLTVDGAALDRPANPLILSPGEHHLVAHADGRRDADKTVRVASGDDLTVELALAELPQIQPRPPQPPAIERPAVVAAPPRPRRFAIRAGFGTDLQRTRDTGAPALGVSAMIGSRLELGADATLVAYAVLPAVRVRLAGDALSVHVLAAAPIVFAKGEDGAMSSTFVAGAGGLGVRYRPAPILAFRLEAMVSYAGKTHGTTYPLFLGGELWF